MLHPRRIGILIVTMGTALANDDLERVEEGGVAVSRNAQASSPVLAEARFQLGLMSIRDGVPADAAEAFRRSADHGHAEAQFSLGVMYGAGAGVPRDYAEAARWLRLAAEQGHARAQFFLGVIYDEGEGVPRDDAAAVSWYRKAAEQGHASAQFNLGLKYARGEGVPQDAVRAYAWMNVAAARGDEVARDARETLAEIMSRAQIAEAQVLSRDLNGRVPRR